MSEMVEHVAKCMAGGDLSTLDFREAEYWRSKASSAIGGMRDPTKQMLIAADANADFVRRWRAAMTAVLSPNSEGK